MSVITLLVLHTDNFNIFVKHSTNMIVEILPPPFSPSTIGHTGKRLQHLIDSRVVGNGASTRAYFSTYNSTIW